MRSNRYLRFFVYIKWYKSYDYFMTMAGDDDGLQRLSTKVGDVEGDINTMKSILDLVVQKLKKLSLKIDDRSLAEDIYRSGHDHQSN